MFVFFKNKIQEPSQNQEERVDWEGYEKCVGVLDIKANLCCVELWLFVVV